MAERFQFGEPERITDPERYGLGHLGQPRFGEPEQVTDEVLTGAEDYVGGLGGLRDDMVEEVDKVTRFEFGEPERLDELPKGMTMPKPHVPIEQRRAKLKPGEFDKDLFDYGKYGMKDTLIQAVIEKESNFRPDVLSRSDKYDPNTGKQRPDTGRAAGLMQMRVPAWTDANKFLGTDYPPELRTDPELNVKLGSAYLNHMISRAGGDVRKGLAMYYAGEGGYRSNPQLKKEGDAYAKDVLQKQLKYERRKREEQGKTRRQAELEGMSGLERAGVAAAEGLVGAAAGPALLGTLAIDVGKWMAGIGEPFELTGHISKQIERIPDEEKSVAERAIVYGVSSLGPGGKISRTTGTLLDTVFDVLTSPFVKRNVAGGAVGATVGAVDHYSRDTMFEGWSPIVSGVAGAFATRNIGNDKVALALSGSTKIPEDVFGETLQGALTRTPFPKQMTTAQVLGDPVLAKLQNRVAQFEEVGGDLHHKLARQGQTLQKKGIGAFPGNEDRVLVQLQEEANYISEEIAKAIGNPSRVEGEIQLHKFLSENQRAFKKKADQLYDLAKPHPILNDVRPIEAELNQFFRQSASFGLLTSPAGALRKALYNDISPPAARAKTYELKDYVDYNELKEAWGALGVQDLMNNKEAQLIKEWIQDLAVNPRTNPDGHEYAATANQFYNGMMDVYQPRTGSKGTGPRSKESLLYKEELRPHQRPGETPLRTGISSYDDVADIRRLSRPIESIEGGTYVQATEEQIQRATQPVLESGLAEAALSAEGVIPGAATKYIQDPEKAAIHKEAGFDPSAIVPLDQRLTKVSGTLKTFEDKNIKEAVFDVVENPAKFKDFVETTKRYGAKYQTDWQRLAAIEVVDSMFPADVARTAADPAARKASDFNPEKLLNSYGGARMFHNDQRRLLMALNQARAAISETAGAGTMDVPELARTIPNSVVTRLARWGIQRVSGREKEWTDVLSKRDARLLAAALHDPQIAAKVMNVPPTAKGLDYWYKRMENDLGRWERKFVRDLGKGEIAARKVNEFMSRSGMRGFLVGGGLERELAPSDELLEMREKMKGRM